MRSQKLRVLVVTLLVSVAVVVGHLLPGLDNSAIDGEIRNALHVIGFALIAAAIFETLPMRTTKAALVTLVIVAALGALAEFAQKFDGKGIDLSDLSRDIAGATLYLCARIVWKWTNAAGRSPVVRLSAQVVSSLLGVLIFAPLSYWLYVNAIITANFPMILGFDGRWDAYLYSPVNSEIRLVESRSSGDKYAGTFAEILLLHRGWSGLRFEPVVSDWSSYRFLTMRAAIDSADESSISVYISHREHSGYRFQYRVGAHDVGPEPIVIRFPLRGTVDILGRPDFDPSKITDVYIIAKTRRKGKDKRGDSIMSIDNIRLE